MRAIKFRGLRIDGNGWAYGLPKYNQGELSVIVDADGLEWGVDSETVGQYIELRDKNDREIYETDILSFRGVEVHQVKVVYDTVGFAFEDIATGSHMEFPRMEGHIVPGAFDRERFEVIGRIVEATP